MKCIRCFACNRREKGITLIALVLTIIILMILAGISLTMIAGDGGLIKNAKEIAAKTKISKLIEELELIKTNSEVEAKTKGGNVWDIFIDKLQQKEDEGLITLDKIDDDTYIVTADGEKIEVTRDDETGEIIIRPADEEGKIQNIIKLSSYKATITYPGTETFTITKNKSGSELSVRSSAPDVATVEYDKDTNTVTITAGTTAGEADIIITSEATDIYAETQTIAATGHSWGSWTVTKAATKTTDGSQKRTCSTCGTSETQTIPKTGTTCSKCGGTGKITPSSSSTTKAIGWASTAHHVSACQQNQVFNVSAWKCTNCSSVYPSKYKKTCGTCGAVCSGGYSSFSSAHSSCTCKTCGGSGVV